MREDDKANSVANERNGHERPFLRSVMRGIRGVCPSCGNGGIFATRLAIQPTCPACGEPLHHHRADDLPPYLNILLTGHVVVGAMLIVMTFDLLSIWYLTGLTVTLAVAAALLFMRPLKGAVIGAQWALRMHGFGGDES